MIHRDDLALAARHLDAMAEEQGMEYVVRLHKLDEEGALYVAEQRALRTAMMLDGQDPGALSRTEKTPVTLSNEARTLMPHLTALSLDGIMIGIRTAQQQ